MAPAFPFRPFGEYGWAGSEDPYEEPYEDPLAQDDNWYELLADASGLNTSPNTGLVSPPTVATKDGGIFCNGGQKGA